MEAIGGGTEEEATELHEGPGSNKRKLEKIQTARQRSREEAVRYFKKLASKRPRFDVASDPPSSSQFDVAQKPASQLSAYAQAQPGSLQGSIKRMDIPNAMVGVIIGKNGETIDHLRTQSGARIHITKDKDPYLQTRNVEIRGTSEQITKAEQLIKDCIAKTDADRGSSFGSQGGDKISMDLPIDKVDLLIGMKGEAIDAIQSRTEACIDIIPLHHRSGDTSYKRRVYICGNKKQIDSAKNLVNDVISGKRLSDLSTPNTHPQQGYAPPRNCGQPPMQQPGHGYAQPGSFAGASLNYPQQPAANPPAAHLPPQQNTGYPYYGQQPLTEAGSAQPNASYGYGQQAPTETGSTQPNASYAYGNKEQIDSAKNLVNEVTSGNLIRNLSTPNTYPQQGYTPPGNWGQPPMQQPGHGYAQPGSFAAASPPNYSNYPQQPDANPPAAHLPPQQNTGYSYYGLAPTEAGSAQPNASYAYGQTAPTANNTCDHSYSQQAQSYGQEAPAQVPQYDQQNQYTTPGYGPQSYAAQPPPAYPYNQQQTVTPAGYGPPQTYVASQQGYDQSGYTQPGYAGQKPPQFLPPVQNSLPTSYTVYGQGGYPSQPIPAQSTYTQWTNPPVYGQQQPHLQPAAYTEPLAYGSEKNGKTTHTSYGSYPAMQEGVHPQN